MGETDRVRVPTNGHRPALEAVAEEASARTASARDPDTDDGVAGADLRIAFTPGQLAAGFGILAGVILLVLGSRRRGGDRDRRG
jgi:hypothetical protein